MPTFIIRIGGDSCNYYVETVKSTRWAFTTRRADAQGFTTEIDARLVAQGLYATGIIGHWEIQERSRAY